MWIDEYEDAGVVVSLESVWTNNTLSQASVDDRKLQGDIGSALTGERHPTSVVNQWLCTVHLKLMVENRIQTPLSNQ